MTSLRLSGRALRAIVILLGGAATCACDAQEAPVDVDVDVKAHVAQALDAVIDWPESQAMGRGLDLIEGVPKGDCVVTTDVIDTVPSAAGNVTTWRIDLIKDAASLQRSMHISAAASMRAGFGSGSAKASFAQEIAVNQYSVYALASVSVEKGTRSMRDVLLKPLQADRVHQGHMDQFRAACGDRFVIGERSGGELYIVFELFARDESERRSIEAEVKAKGGSGAWALRGTFQDHLQTLSAHSALQIRAFKVGGSNAPLGGTSDELIERALAFEQEVDARPVPLRAILAAYETTDNFDGPSPIAVTRQALTIEDLNATRLELSKRLTDVEYVQLHPDEFEAFDGPALDVGADQLRESLDAVYRAWVMCAEDLDACVHPELGSITLLLPARHDGEAPVAPPPDPHAGQSFTADEACGVAAYNVAIGEVCGVKATTYREGSGDVCGAVDFVLMRSSQCGVESYQERKNKACPGYDPNRRENRYASQKTLQMGSPPPLPTCAAGDEAMRQNTGLQISGWPEVETFCVKLPSCRLPEHGVDQWNECRDPAHGPVWGRCRHPNFGVESVEFAACAHPSFGIAAYNVCWH